jgi:hypothetical protein
MCLSWSQVQRTNCPACGQKTGKNTGDDMPNLTLEQQIEKLKAENEALRAKSHKAISLSCKVTGKGGVSLYGLGRFPVTLYKSQWDALLAGKEAIGAFIKAHEAELSTKE